jgi:FtsP/CotA-like multicopper oxidase with cupredoxin domain
MISRRDFIKLSGAGLAALYVSTQGKFTMRARASVSTLDPLTVPKYVTPLLIPPVMPKAGITRQKGKAIDYYEISMRQFKQQILPPTMPKTTVWGYGAVSAANKKGLRIHNAPSLTIEADWNRPVRIKWINELVDSNGHYLSHLLPVDPTLHWANPPGGMDGRDHRPDFEATPEAYTGPVPMVSHVHGAVGVGDESDGYAEAWYLPAATDIPAGYATEGTWYDYFKNKALNSYGAAWGPGFATFQYPNHNRASTIWYHDHTLGMTRINVYAGPAGFYIIRGGPAGDAAVIDTRFGTAAVFPGPAPKEGDHFPFGKAYYEIPIAIQDRAFYENGSLFYPDSRTLFDEIDQPYIPDGDFSPIWNPEFFGNMIMVNGNTWPYQTVEQRRYRFRFLNGCQSRFLILDFNNIPGVEVWQVGNEGGFLATPVNITADHDNRLLMGLAERADVIVDFTNVPVGNYVLGNVGPDEPFGGGDPDEEFEAADPDSTGQIIQFRVIPMPVGAVDTSTPPMFMQLPAIKPLPAETVTRKLALIEIADVGHDAENNEIEGPVEAVLGNVDGDGMPVSLKWMDEITENPKVGDTEVWEIYNFTADAHPMHVHEVTFEVVNRQALVTNEDGETEPPARLHGNPRPPEAWESGRKDTVIAYPGEVTRIRAKFDKAGQFVWHCHIVEHEDNEMMRPYRIGPADPNAPGGEM